MCSACLLSRGMTQFTAAGVRTHVRLFTLSPQWCCLSPIYREKVGYNPVHEVQRHRAPDHRVQRLRDEPEIGAG